MRRLRPRGKKEKGEKMIKEIMRRRCAVCGMEFTVWSNHPDQRSCSRPCGLVLRARRIKENLSRHATLAEILAQTEKYHPERFAELPWWDADWCRMIQDGVMKEISKGRVKGQAYEWFYNHALVPDEVIAERILGKINNQREVMGL